MTLPALGNLEKMSIEVFDKVECTGLPLKTIFVQLNPEKYTIKHNVVFFEGQPIGAAGTSLEFNKIEGEDVSFDFVFDSSGVIPPGKIVDGKGSSMSLLETVKDTLQSKVNNPFDEVKSVDVEVEEFRKLLMGYIGSTHQISYLLLIWGNYRLNCRLKSMDIEYSLFRKDGRPIRAKVKCVFKGTVSYEVMVAEQNKMSPDITHERTLEMNSKISLMAENIYENPNYYIDVSNHNGLLSFRNSTTGQVLLFPPIK
jgi:Contractile injection system tube protein